MVISLPRVEVRTRHVRLALFEDVKLTQTPRIVRYSVDDADVTVRHNSYSALFLVTGKNVHASSWDV